MGDATDDGAKNDIPENLPWRPVRGFQDETQTPSDRNRNSRRNNSRNPPRHPLFGNY